MSPLLDDNPSSNDWKPIETKASSMGIPWKSRTLVEGDRNSGEIPSEAKYFKMRKQFLRNGGYCEDRNSYRDLPKSIFSFEQPPPQRLLTLPMPISNSIPNFNGASKPQLYAPVSKALALLLEENSASHGEVSSWCCKELAPLLTSLSLRLVLKALTDCAIYCVINVLQITAKEFENRMGQILYETSVSETRKQVPQTTRKEENP
ncbi:hypothetical protein F5146DRAFT_997597 [Armillaria mellea]|nr:hypothetical protein F5146DRAFT_997597 [Armillaria mellea]